jgi:probable F420-dependent oxidoreductase
VKFGVMYNTAVQGVDPMRLTTVAQHAESLGFKSFYAPEHISLYVGASIYGGTTIPSDAVIADPLECLTFVAASTRRILLGTAVLVLPYHQPVQLAKRLATIVGSLPGEATAAGVDFRTRGRRADEAIDVMRLLWAGGAGGVDFEGEFFTLEKTTSFPKPFAGTTLPIHIGGASNPAARRAGLRGDGFFSGGKVAPAERLAQAQLMRDTAIGAGRDPGHVELSRWGSLDLDHAGVASLAQQGVSRLVIGLPGGSLDGLLRSLDDFASRHELSV